MDKEIENLKTVDDKRNYLESIFEEDQKVRGSEGAEIVVKYGAESIEYREYIQNIGNQDSINLLKIERYFELYGHPKKDKVGEIAAVTPWAVIHHANEYDARERNFEILYAAFLDREIDEGAFSMFLGRMYEMKNGERFKRDSSYTSADEINQLIVALNLEKKRGTIQQSMDGHTQ